MGGIPYCAALHCAMGMVSPCLGLPPVCVLRLVWWWWRWWSVGGRMKPSQAAWSVGRSVVLLLLLLLSSACSQLSGIVALTRPKKDGKSVTRKEKRGELRERLQITREKGGRERQHNRECLLDALLRCSRSKRKQASKQDTHTNTHTHQHRLNTATCASCLFLPMLPPLPAQFCNISRHACLPDETKQQSHAPVRCGTIQAVEARGKRREEGEKRQLHPQSSSPPTYGTTTWPARLFVHYTHMSVYLVLFSNTHVVVYLLS